jgi:hypothetical protein
MLTAITCSYFVRNFNPICQDAWKVCVDIHTSPASKFYNAIHETPAKDLVAGNM